MIGGLGIVFANNAAGNTAGLSGDESVVVVGYVLVVALVLAAVKAARR